MINRFALSFLCIELDRDIIFGVMLVYILLSLLVGNHVMSLHAISKHPVCSNNYNISTT